VHGAINAREVIGRVLNGDSVPPGEFAALFRVEQTTGYAITPEERAAADAAAAASLATPQQKRPLSPAEAAAVEAAARGDVLPPDAFAALINDGTRVPAKDHGENTRPIRWTAQAPGGDGAQEGWMMPTRTAGATVPAIEAEAGDGYVSVMADVEIPEGALTAFAPEQPLSPAEFEARMRELNSERNLLEKALHDGDIAPEDAPATQARLAVVIDQETKLQAKGPGGRNGSDDSLGTMARVLAGLRKL
jgi:hypothetical protein